MEGRLELNGLDNLDLVLRQAISLPNEVEKAKEIIRRKSEAKEQGINAREFNKVLKAVEDQSKSLKAIPEGEELTIAKDKYELPPGYYVWDDAIFNVEDPNNAVITHPLAVSAESKNIDTNHTKFNLVWERKGVVHSAFVDAERLASKQKLIELANQGIQVNSVNASAVIKYLSDFLYHNEDIVPLVNSVGRCGWLKADGKEIFAPYSEDLLFDGEDSVGNLFNAINTKKGSLETYLEAIKKYRQDNNIIKIVIAASLASVLVPKLHGLPFIVHLWGGTGIGKTMAMNLGATVWAERTEYTKNFNATRIGLEQVCVFLNHLPLFIDELQIKRDSKDFDNLIHTLTEGSGRTRSKKTGGLQYSESWCNTIITSGEMPISKAHSGGGVLNRVLEIYCPDKDLFEDFDEPLQIMIENYGLLGREFVKIVEQKQPEEIKADYQRLYKGLRQEEGYTDKQYRSAAYLMLADEYLEYYLLQNGDSLLYDDILQHLTKAEDVDINKRAYDYLMDMIGVNINRFDDDSLGEIWGKVDMEKNCFCINSTVFNKLLRDSEFDSRPFVKWLRKKEFLLPANNGESVQNIRIKGEQTRCYCIRRPET